ncbi:MAG: hypothetical protein JJ863_08185 [Deltaproteobacteria bacterium]|nr:hypothetical protein [Deltaproteobacteria bacterium]
MHRTLVLVSLVVLAGCSGPYLDVGVSSRGDLANLHISSERGATITVMGESFEWSDEASDFLVPYASLEPGDQTIEVHAEMGGRETIGRVSLTVPNRSTEPYVQLLECTKEDDAEVHLDVRGTFGLLEHCTQADGTIHVELAVTPGASLEVAGEAVAVGPRGMVGLDLSVGDDVLDAIPSGEGATAIGLPVVVENDGARLEGRFEVAVEVGQALHEMTRGFQGGSPLHPDLEPITEGGMLLYRPERFGETMEVIGASLPMRQTRYVAIAELRDVVPSTEQCGPYQLTDIIGRPEPGTRAHTLPRSDERITVIVYAAHSGEEVMRQTIDSTGLPCPTSIRSGATSAPVSASGRVRTWLLGLLN